MVENVKEKSNEKRPFPRRSRDATGIEEGEEDEYETSWGENETSRKTTEAETNGMDSNGRSSSRSVRLREDEEEQERGEPRRKERVSRRIDRPLHSQI